MIVFVAGALDDLERLFNFTAEADLEGARRALRRIRSAISVLEEHPFIGRPVGKRSHLRELVISHGKTGYVALYAYSELDDTVTILGVRHQREAGYPGR